MSKTIKELLETGQWDEDAWNEAVQKYKQKNDEEAESEEEVRKLHAEYAGITPESESKKAKEKADLTEAERLKLEKEGLDTSKVTKELQRKLKKQIFPISAVTGEGIKELTELLWDKTQQIK